MEAMKCSVSILMSTNTYMHGRLVTSTGTKLRFVRGCTWQFGLQKQGCVCTSKAA